MTQKQLLNYLNIYIQKDIDKQIISKNVVTYLGQNVRSVFNKIIEDIKNETGVSIYIIIIMK